jgi:hypothetical protein
MAPLAGRLCNAGMVSEAGGATILSDCVMWISDSEA